MSVGSRNEDSAVGPSNAAATRPVGRPGLCHSSTAALVEPHSAIPASPKLATIVLMFTIAPPPLEAIRGANAPVRTLGD
jgi:hypothetical protein